MPERAFIALGSNLGDSVALLRQAMERLQSLSIEPPVRSSFWRSSPVDCPPGSADFVNAVVSLLPPGHFTPSAFLHELKALEAEFGRKPKLILNEARPLDLDLIAWGATSMQTAELTLPHPRAHLRKFVLAPLSEIAPELVLPGHEKPVSELLANLRTGETIERI